MYIAALFRSVLIFYITDISLFISKPGKLKENLRIFLPNLENLYSKYLIRTLTIDIDGKYTSSANKVFT